MSGKTELPDEVMALVSGGVLTYGGERVHTFYFATNPKTMETTFTIATESQTVTNPLPAKDQAAVKANPGLIQEWSDGLAALYSDVKVHRMEDIME